MTNVKIYVACHKRYDYLLKIPYDYYIPIHCGKAIYVEEGNGEYLPELGDDTGDNISARNPNYCELTAMYWAWKNDHMKPNDIIGLNHYRRYFAEENDNNEFLTKETIISWLENCDFLIDGADTETDNTEFSSDAVFYGYKDCHIQFDMDMTIYGIKLLYPDIYPKLNHELRHSGAMNCCNLFITRKYLFDEYAKFLFDVFQYVETRIDINDNDHQGYNARVYGFLAERLLRPYLKAKGYKSRTTPILDWEAYSGYEWI